VFEVMLFECSDFFPYWGGDGLLVEEPEGGFKLDAVDIEEGDGFIG
jgi:hypothetical protein